MGDSSRDGEDTSKVSPPNWAATITDTSLHTSSEDHHHNITVSVLVLPDHLTLWTEPQLPKVVAPTEYLDSYATSMSHQEPHIDDPPPADAAAL